MRHVETRQRAGRPAISGGRERESWIAEHVPADVRRRAEIVFDVLTHVPLQQPVVVVTAEGETAAVNAAFLCLAGGEAEDYLGRDWAAFMPAWPRRSSLVRPGTQAFEEVLAGVSGTPLWVRVSLGSVLQGDGDAAAGYVLFVSKPDLDVLDQAEVRRLRKGYDLLADVQTDFVVEIDRAGSMTFVSPSLCRAVGAPEAELIGRLFLSRVCADDRAAAAEALAEARRPPFVGEMRARLSCARGTEVVWQIEAVIGDGVTGFELVGRAESRS